MFGGRARTPDEMTGLSEEAHLQRLGAPVVDGLSLSRFFRAGFSAPAFSAPAFSAPGFSALSAVSAALFEDSGGLLLLLRGI
jgi:hypothetical protein